MFEHRSLRWPITLGVINNMLNMVGISPYLQGAVKGVVIIGAVFIQRQRQ